MESLLEPFGLLSSSLCTLLDSRLVGALAVTPRDTTWNRYVYLDAASMRAGRLQLMERGSVGSIHVPCVGAPTPGTTVAIVNVDTEELCGATELGEIWVTSDATPTAIALREGEATEQATAETLRCQLASAARGVAYCRTGLLGFVHVCIRSVSLP